MSPSVDFLSGRGRVWAALTRATRQTTRPSYVAVAYFGSDAPHWLPLKRGSRLVVDASDAVVKSGQTCPASLQEMLTRGVLVYSRTGLHAKVFIIGNTAFIGSANVSGHSAKHLIEAIAVTRQREVVAKARQFVREHCHGLIGPEEITRLSTIYRPPVWKAGSSTRHRRSVDTGLRVVRLRT